MAKTPSLTGLDWQLLKALNDDARATISDIASALGRSRTSVSDHFNKLVAMGVITKFTTQVSEEKIGIGIAAFVRLEASSKEHRKIVNTVNSMPEVAECHVLTGSDLLMMRLVARDMPHLRSLVDGMTQWGSTTTDVIFSTVKPALEISPQLREKLRD